MKTWTTTNGYRIIRVLAGRSNVFMVEGNGKYLLVDTSPGYRWGTLQNRLMKLGIKKIDYLILTHTHFDHSANARRIKETYNAKVIVHKAESAFLESGDNILPVGTNLFSGFIVHLFAKQFISMAKYEPCQPDITVNSDSYTLDQALRVRIIHTPGHTTGSVSVIIDDEIALTGDAMFGIFFRSIYPPFASNTVQMIKSWGKLLNTNARLFLPSHGSANLRSLVEKEFIRHSREI
jgi:hydroxyacylglutathione hydrolase